MRLNLRPSQIRDRAAVAIAACFVVCFLAAAGDPPRSKSKIDIPALVELHNKARANEDLGPLTVNEKLVAAAKVQAKDMGDHEEMRHEGSDGSDAAKRAKDQGYRYQLVGENVAMGQRSSAEVMTAWMNSPHHKENILRPDHTEIGLACYTTADGVPYWCAVFAKPWPEIEPKRDAQAMLDALNAARAEAKSPPLKIDSTLEASAKAHADAIAEAGKFLDKDHDGKTPTERAQRNGYKASKIAQNDAMGQGDPVKVVKRWLDAEGDSREILLSAAYKDVGIGVASDKAGVPYWCVIVGQSREKSTASAKSGGR